MGLDQSEDRAREMAEESGISLEIILQHLAATKNTPDIPDIKQEKPDTPPPSKPKIKEEVNVKFQRGDRLRPRLGAPNKIEPDTKYSFGPRKSHRLVRRNHVWINKKASPGCFRDQALNIIDFEKYHENSMPQDEYARKILALSRWRQQSQIDKFIYDSKPFFISTWLTTARIFEYNSKNSRYFEAKRIPQRYIDLSSNLITSVHYCDSKFYIAYLSDKQCDDHSKKSQAFIETRDIHGRLLDDPYYYDHVVKSIHSDKKFLYVKTVKNIIYLHKRNYFNFNPHRVDMSFITQDSIINLYAKTISTTPYPRLSLITATPGQLLISRLDALEHTIWQNYDFNFVDGAKYTTISMYLIQNKVLLHRNLIDADANFGDEATSKIEVGFIHNMAAKKSKSEGYFIHERSISFTYHIVQSQLSDDGKRLFVFGRKNGEYEVGALLLDDLRPLFRSRLQNVDANCRMIAHDDHIIMFEGKQNFSTYNFNTNTASHTGIFRDIKVMLNQKLQ